jgi:hypothetical protein
MNTLHNTAIDYSATAYAFKYLGVKINTLCNTALDYRATAYAFV